ncbi:MAG: hypothetical protein H6817_08435 [Phycisphaerales bacterium]|nr:hypothetical protein [Phycisphaerales bacterium]
MRISIVGSGQGQMGIDILEIFLRVEAEFGVSLSSEDIESLHPNRSRWHFDFTAGELHFLIGCKLEESGATVPADLWERLVPILATTTGTPRDEIQPGNWFVRDLGAT